MKFQVGANVINKLIGLITSYRYVTSKIATGHSLRAGLIFAASPRCTAGYPLLSLMGCHYSFRSFYP